MSEVNRREFMGTCGAVACVAALPAVPCPAPTLRLFTVTDVADPDPYGEIWGWWEAVWARNENEALAWAHENYGGECRAGEDPGIRVACAMEANERSFPPGKTGVHREPRMSVLRDAGWRDESDTCCECCELYSLGYAEYRVCDECYLCPECRVAEAEDPCESCSPVRAAGNIGRGG